MKPIGKTLSEKRIEKGLTVEDVSDDIKIRRKYVEAIESGNYSEIPDKVYTKSFLKIYAEYLGLDQVYVLKRYLDEVSQEETVSMPAKTLGALRERHYLNTKDKSNFTFLSLVSVVLAILLFAWITISIIQRYGNKQSQVNVPGNHEIVKNDPSDEKAIAENPENPSSTEIPNLTEPDLPVPIEEIELPFTTPVYSFDKLIVEITTRDKVWVSYTTDDTKRESFTLPAQATRSFEAERKVVFQIGNAGGLNIIINHFELGVIGKSGEVMDLEVILSPGQSIKVNVIKDGKVIETKTFTEQ